MDIKNMVKVCPSQRQLIWQQMEFYGFVHFGLNTMNNREWGLENEDLRIFNPKNLDCDQWAISLKKAGMTGAILTCKHHDGFCLWPSDYSEHTIANTPYKNGLGDVVKEFAEACKRVDLKFGVYLSPWDRTEKTYGYGKAYDDFYVNQLMELLTNYGEIYEVWFDGANGEGDNGKKQYYDWERYYETIRRIQPNAVIAVCGPDVRWVGNEAGQTRQNEWSVVPAELQDVEKIAESSQKEDDGEFSRKVSSGEEDLGSRKALADYQGQLIWYPAEVNTSIRPGWFYHQNEDDKVRPSDELFDLYCNAVGGNATFLLNIPPTPEGLFHPNDCQALTELGEKIASLKKENLVSLAEINFSSCDEEPNLASFDGFNEGMDYWQPKDTDSAPTIHVKWDEQQTFDTLIIQENIMDSQRIEKMGVIYKKDEKFHNLIEVESVGYKRILRFDPITTDEIKLEFLAYREYPTVANLVILNQQ